MPYVKNKLWIKYNLCIDDSVRGRDFRKATRCHDMVVDYLEKHPDIAKEYLVTHRYFDILSFAERV